MAGRDWEAACPGGSQSCITAFPPDRTRVAPSKRHEKFRLPACRLFSLHQRVAGTYHREDASGSAYFFSAPFGGVPGFCGLLMS